VAHGHTVHGRLFDQYSLSMRSVPTPARRCFLLAVITGLLLPLPSVLTAQAAPPPPPTSEGSRLTAAQRDSVVAVARAQIGHRYRLGGERPEEGFDCSGLIRHILSAFDLRAPRTAALQALFGREVPKDHASLKPGDILTFGRGNRISHVGIYVGEGRFVHASTSTRRVVESNLADSRSSLVRQWRGVRRVLASADTTPAPTLVPATLAPVVVTSRRTR
jgi:cell wall-associated NlpC family hydrolase